MILPYMFVIRSSPTVMSQNYGKIGGALVHVWVMDDDGEAALSRACDYIRKYLYPMDTRACARATRLYYSLFLFLQTILSLNLSLSFYFILNSN